MFNKHNLGSQGENEVSFVINSHLKIFLECNKPPYASHLSLVEKNSKLIDISIPFDSSEKLKNAMSDPACTDFFLLNLLEQLQLNKFALEVQNEMKRSTSEHH